MATPSTLLDQALGLAGAGAQSPASTSLPAGSVVVIEDSVETSGAFVIHHLLKRSLSSPHSSTAVIFVALSHPFSHYDRVLRKLGCNLVSHRDNKRFFFFDMLMLECSDGDEEDVHKGGLVELYGKIQKVVDDICHDYENGKRITIVIDDFSLIEVAANGYLNHSLNFLHYCYSLTSEFGCSLVTLNHEDIYAGMDRPTLIIQMEYLANILVRSEPLSTGLASDIHGQLTVVNKRSTRKDIQNNFHFKIKENGIECFYPGARH